MSKIGLIKDRNLTYDCIAPFDPLINYPEYPFEQLAEKNPVYDAVRTLFHQMGMDIHNFGSPLWNPLGEVIKPGDTVLLKPNMVRHYNPVGDLDCVITHGSVVRAVLDYVYIALKGRGQIIIGDAPLQDCDFERVASHTGLDKIVAFYSQHGKLQVKLMDLRLVGSCKHITGLISRKRLDGDLSGYVAVDLKEQSELFEIIDDFEKFRVANYDKEEMVAHHNRQKNEYLISKSVLQADVIIDLPKLKTHSKAGITCSLKNFVGINGLKDWLAHQRIGSLEEGGDEYLHKSIRKRLETKLIENIDVATSKLWAMLLKLSCLAVAGTGKIFPHKSPYREGGWYGNDTVPRTIADLNRIALYADKNGILQETVQRRILVVVDAIIAGEKEGPLHPSPKHCGLLVAGRDPVAVDFVCSKIMGFDYLKIPQFKYALKERKCRILQENLEDIEFAVDKCKSIHDVYTIYGDNFEPSKGWVGHIERE